jgi:hypothetical protein
MKTAMNITIDEVANSAVELLRDFVAAFDASDGDGLGRAADSARELLYNIDNQGKN